MERFTPKTLLVLAVLLLAAVGLTYWAYSIYHDHGSTDRAMIELANHLMNFSSVVLIGGIVKLLVDDYQIGKERYEKRLVFTHDLLDRLRKINDQVELSRILIESHKSAKTYGEQIRENIIPSNIVLLDLRRSLDDADLLIPAEKIPYLRVSIHYMMAYLRVLILEYQERYLPLSNKQTYQEGIKDRLKAAFAERVFKLYEAENDYETFNQILLGEEFPEPISVVWRDIEELPALRDFLKEGIYSNFYRLFHQHYGFCKKLLRDKKRVGLLTLPWTFDAKYIDYLAEIDAKRLNSKLTPKDSLVRRIIEEKMQFAEVEDEGLS